MNKELIKSILNGNLYDYIACNYYEMSKSDLKNVILELEYSLNHNTDNETQSKIRSEMCSELLEYID